MKTRAAVIINIPMWIWFISAGFIFLGSVADAKGKKENPSAAVAAESETPQVVAVPQPEVASPADERIHPIEFSLYWKPGFSAQSLSGIGFKSSMPLTSQNAFGSELSYRVSSRALVFGKYQQSKVTYNSPSGLLPAIISFKQKEYAGGFEYLFFYDSATLRNLAFSIGYTHLGHSIEETSPNAAITQKVFQGIELGVKESIHLGKSFSLRLKANYFSPNRIVENGQRSGFLQSMFRAKGSLSAFYALSEFVSIGAGFEYSYLSLQFKGTGSRGAIGASESFSERNLPLELRINL